MKTTTEPRIFRSAGLVSLGTLSSRLLGLVREILMAAVFGTSQVGSAFFVAFTIPNLFRRLFGEGALAAAFVPQFVHLREERGPGAAWSLSRSLMAWLIRMLGTISLGGLVVATLLLEVLPGGGKAVTTLLCLRILLPYVVGICLAALMMGVLNSHRRYLVSAFTPCLLNLVWISVLLTVGPRTGLTLDEKVLWISWAILAAGFLQFGVQYLAVRTLRLPRERPADVRSPEVRTVLRRMAPAALGAAVTQINVLADRLLAFWVADYGPAALTYSERLIYLPLGLFATALGTILLPEFSGHVQRRDREQLGATLDRSLRGMTFLMLPAAVGLGLLAEPIVRVMFERDSFDAASTLYTSRALICYAPGLLVFSLAKVFIPVFHAHKDTRTPVKIGAAAVVLNLALNLLFVWTFPEGWKHAGLAVGTVVSVALQVAALGVLTHRRFAPLHPGLLAVSLLRHILACAALTGVCLYGPALLPEASELLKLAALIPAAAAAYFLTALLLRCPEIRELRRH